MISYNATKVCIILFLEVSLLPELALPEEETDAEAGTGAGDEKERELSKLWEKISLYSTIY